LSAIRNHSIHHGRAGRVLMAMVACLLASAGPAFAQFSIDRWTIDGGGADLAGGDFLLRGTSAQPDAGLLSGGGYSLGGGFWGSEAPTLVGVGDPGTDPGATGAPRLTLQIFAPAPNPATASTRIAFELPDVRAVDVEVFSVQGRLVRTLMRGTLDPGKYSLAWDMRQSGGERVGPGIYFVRTRLGELKKTQRLVVIR